MSAEIDRYKRVLEKEYTKTYTALVVTGVRVEFPLQSHGRYMDKEGMRWVQVV